MCLSFLLNSTGIEIKICSGLGSGKIIDNETDKRWNLWNEVKIVKRIAINLPDNTWKVCDVASI